MGGARPGAPDRPLPPPAPGGVLLLYAAYAPASLLVLLGGSPHLLGAAGRLALALAALPVRLAAAAAAAAASGLVPLLLGLACAALYAQNRGLEERLALAQRRAELLDDAAFDRFVRADAALVRRHSGGPPGALCRLPSPPHDASDRRLAFGSPVGGPAASDG